MELKQELASAESVSVLLSNHLKIIIIIYWQAWKMIPTWKVRLKPAQLMELR